MTASTFAQYYLLKNNCTGAGLATFSTTGIAHISLLAKLWTAKRTNEKKRPIKTWINTIRNFERTQGSVIIELEWWKRITSVTFRNGTSGSICPERQWANWWKEQANSNRNGFKRNISAKFNCSEKNVQKMWNF